MKAIKANQNTHYPEPSKAGPIVNNQLSIISPQTCSPALLQPDNLIPRSPFCLLSPVFCPYSPSHPSYRGCPLCSYALTLFPPSCLCAFVSLWLCRNYAKQSQFPQPRNHRNPLHHKHLQQNPAPPASQKQSQTKPTRPSESTAYEVLCLHRVEFNKGYRKEHKDRQPRP